MVGRRAALSVLLALGCVLVLATRVAVEFDRIRTRPVTKPQPAVEPTLAVPLPDLQRFVGEPAAVIVRLRGTTEATNVRLSLDGAPIATVTVPANREIRVDSTAWVRPGTGQVFRLAADRAGWQLTYLEIANVHGYTRGFFSFTIVPGSRTHFRGVSWWWLLPLLIVLLVQRPRREWPSGIHARRWHRAGVAIAILLFLATLLTDRFTQFKLLISPTTWLLCVAVLYAERIVPVYHATVWAAGRVWSAMWSRVGSTWHRVVHTCSAIAGIPRLPAAIAAALAVTVAAAAYLFGVNVAGGADSYGYVSQSELWARGKLYVDQRLAKELPDYVDDWLLTPLGFTPQEHSAVRGRIVPTYSPGLPMVMAVFRLAFGEPAVYFVVPALTGLAVWLTFVLGRRLNGDATGLFAAVWVASSPGILGSSFTPMSDVPVTTWWVAALVAACRPTIGSAAVAGIATSLAILTRPNLALLGGIIGLPFLVRWALRPREGRRLVALLVFGATACIGPIIVALLFNYWYGSPFRSGYGTVGGIFKWDNVQANLARYPRWLIETQTPLILVGLVTPFLLRGRKNPGALISPVAAAWLFLALAALVWFSYIAYMPFDDWGYLRFLLPSYPPLMALSSAAFVLVLRRTMAPRALGTILVSLIAITAINFGLHHSIFEMANGEGRYKRIGEYVGRNMPEHALYLTMQHSGSLRYYSGRTTIRYDQFSEDRLDQLVAYFGDRGLPVYFVLDDWEEKEFRNRFGPYSVLGKLDWKPVAQATGSTPMAIYDPRTRGTAQADPKIIP